MKIFLRVSYSIFAELMEEHQNAESDEEIQRMLDRNSFLIKSILQFQNEGRIADVMLYKAQLQINLEKLAHIAESKGQNNAVGSGTLNGSDPSVDTQVQLSKFVRTVKENGLKNLKLISEITGIQLEKIAPLSQAYIAFLKRKNRFTEAKQLENELAVNGVEDD